MYLKARDSVYIIRCSMSTLKKSRGPAPPRLDAANLAGITTLMNPQHIKQDANLENAEKYVMGKKLTGLKSRENDPVRIYTAELNQLADDLGIDLLEDVVAPTTASFAPTPKSFAPTPKSFAPTSKSFAPTSKSFAPVSKSFNSSAVLRPSSARRDSPTVSESSITSVKKFSIPSKSFVTPEIYDVDSIIQNKDQDGGDEEEEEEDCDCDDDCSENCDCECHEDCDCDDDCSESCDCDCHDDDSQEKSVDESEKVDNIISRLEDDLGIHTDGSREKRRNQVHNMTALTVRREKSANDGGTTTNEQEKRRHINGVVSDIRGETRTTFGVERERIQDIKASKLEQISQLRMTLEEEGIDCSSVNTPKSESPMEEIDSVLNILRLKNDRNRYSSLAEEVILGFAEGIETVFDGSRTVPLVGWKPDYTGYHNTVNVKLHRMRHETSQVVGNIIEKYNIGPTARIIMELLPSFFLYPRQQKKQRGTPGLSSDPHISDARGALNTIRESDERKSLDSIRSI